MPIPEIELDIITKSIRYYENAHTNYFKEFYIKDYFVISKRPDITYHKIIERLNKAAATYQVTISMLSASDDDLNFITNDYVGVILLSDKATKMLNIANAYFTLLTILSEIELSKFMDTIRDIIFFNFHFIYNSKLMRDKYRLHSRDVSLNKFLELSDLCLS